MRSTTSLHRAMLERALVARYTRLTLTILASYGYLKWYEAALFACIRRLPVRCSGVEKILLRRVFLRQDLLTPSQSSLRTRRLESTVRRMELELPAASSSTTRVR